MHQATQFAQTDPVQHKHRAKDKIPTSAPAWLTPKYLNLVLVPVQAVGARASITGEGASSIVGLPWMAEASAGPAKHKARTADAENFMVVVRGFIGIENPSS